MNRKQFLRLSAFGCAALPLARAVPPKPATPSPVPTPLRFVTPDDKDYLQLAQGFNKSLVHKPAAIALCRSTADVAQAITYAIDHKLKAAIRSGGHTFEGFSSIDDGLVINLSRMNRIEWLDATRVRIQPGCVLSRINDTLLPKKRLLPGGSCASVGIGGLTLGGGYGLFSRSHGLTCDHLTGLTLVDGKGQVHEVSGEDELLWACRGGGNGNFGVVTDMTFNTRSAPATMQSHRFKAYKLTTPRARSILKTWFQLMETLPESCFSAIVVNGRTIVILITNHGPQTAALTTLFSQLSAITDKTTAGSRVPLAKALKIFYGQTNPTYFKNASAGYYRNFESIAPFIDSILDITLPHGLIYQINTLGGQINRDDSARASCYPHRAYPFLSEIQSYWEKPEQAAHFTSRFAEIQVILTRNGVTAQYVNYPSLLFDHYPEAYFGGSYEKLQALKGRLDPDDLFTCPQGVKAKA